MFTPKEIVDFLKENNQDNNWYVDTKKIGTPPNHRHFSPTLVRNHVTEAHKQLTAKQKKIAAVAGDKNTIDAEDLSKLRSMKKEDAGIYKGPAEVTATKNSDAVAQSIVTARKVGDKASHIISATEKSVREEEQIDEASASTIVNNLKADGKHEEAGSKAFEHGLGRKYGQHFGMRDTKDKDEAAFHRGYDRAEVTSKKKVDEGHLAEISTKTASSYAEKAWASGDDKRAKGMNLAIQKASGKAKVPATVSEADYYTKGGHAGYNWGPGSKSSRSGEHDHEYELEKRHAAKTAAKAARDKEPHHVYINNKVWKKEGKPVEFSNKKHAMTAAVSINKKDPTKKTGVAHHSYTTQNNGVRPSSVKEEIDMNESKIASTLAAMAANRYVPKVGDKIETRMGGQIPGVVTQVTDTHVHFTHPEGKKYKTGLNNVRLREEVEQVDEALGLIKPDGKTWSSMSDKEHLARAKMHDKQSDYHSSEAAKYKSVAHTNRHQELASTHSMQADDHRNEVTARKEEKSSTNEEVESIDEASHGTLTKAHKEKISDFLKKSYGDKGSEIKFHYHPEHGHSVDYQNNKTGEGYSHRITRADGKIKMHPAHMSSDYYREEVESIDELKKSTLRSYAAKKQSQPDEKKSGANIALALTKAAGKPPFPGMKGAKVYAKEEVDSIDEDAAADVAELKKVHRDQNFYVNHEGKVAHTYLHHHNVKKLVDALYASPKKGRGMIGGMVREDGQIDEDAAVRAWTAVHTKGSKAAREKLDKVHAKNPKYHEFKKSLEGHTNVSHSEKPKAAPKPEKSPEESPGMKMRRINAERTKRAMELGKAHRSGGVGSAGTSANQSPLEKKIGGHDVGHLEKKKTTAIGASPAEREGAKAEKKEKEKSAVGDRMTKKLTGKVGH